MIERKDIPVERRQTGVASGVRRAQPHPMEWDTRPYVAQSQLRYDADYDCAVPMARMEVE